MNTGPGDPGGGFNLLPQDATEFPSLSFVKNKRKKGNDGSSSLKVMYDQSEPVGIRYVLIQPTDPNNPISSNPFQLAKEIDTLAGKVLDVQKMKSGDVLVKAKTF